jgi:arginine repressor
MPSQNLWIRPFTADLNDGNMKYPVRNFVYEKIQESENLTDSELLNSLAKAGVNLSEANLAKTLIDLEIYGLIRVFWISKEKKRIELRPNTMG